MKVFELQYKLKKNQTNKWEIYYCNVLSIDKNHIIHWFNEIFGENNYKIIECYEKNIVIHGIDKSIQKNIINDNIKEYINQINGTIDDKLYELNNKKELIKRAENDFWSIDEKINDGKMKEKRENKNVWSKNKY